MAVHHASNDTSIGDALNWEWMVECALRNQAELVIVSRDSDYGVVFEDNAYVNDHLRQEFSERVSRKRKLLLYTKLSDALKHFAVPVTPEEEAEEEEIIQIVQLTPDPVVPAQRVSLMELAKFLHQRGLGEVDKAEGSGD
jgi:hypothetical protein